MPASAAWPAALYKISRTSSGAGPAEAFERLDVLLRETGRTLVHPFDDPLTIAGQGTVGLEILEDLVEVETIVVPIGGGGLVAGIAAAVAGRASVVGVEPELSTAMHSALAAGEPVAVTPTSIADGLNAPHAGRMALEIVRERVDDVVLVTEDEIRSLAISQRLLGTEEIILIHHTDCGMLTFHDDEFRQQVKDDTGIKPQWAAEAFDDVDEDVRQSIARIEASPFIPRKDSVRGFVYDVETGRLREVA